MQHDLPVEHERNVLDIHQVIFHTLDHFLAASGITELNHTPGSQTGLDFQQVTKIWRMGVQLVDIIFAFRPGADEAHFSSEDIPKLGKLVDAPFTHGPAPGGDALVVVGGKGGAVLFRIGVHRPEFIDLEFYSFETDAFLLIDDRAGGGKSGRLTRKIAIP